jgi:hypothetical protein
MTAADVDKPQAVLYMHCSMHRAQGMIISVLTSDDQNRICGPQLNSLDAFPMLVQLYHPVPRHGWVHLLQRLFATNTNTGPTKAPP